jgi:hypothetical protein
MATVVRPSDDAPDLEKRKYFIRLVRPVITPIVIAGGPTRWSENHETHVYETSYPMMIAHSPEGHSYDNWCLVIVALTRQEMTAAWQKTEQELRDESLRARACESAQQWIIRARANGFFKRDKSRPQAK